MKYLGRKIVFFLIILIPFWSFLVWFFYPKTELPGLILDKTVLESSGVEHRSFNWITTNRKFVKPDGSQYEISEDYYGFFPVNRPEYVVKDLTVFNNADLDSMARDMEYVYYTDAYGVYTNEWVYGRDINERSRLVYGGLSEQSYKLFEKMFRNRKLTLTEFNNLASPTPLQLRFKMQRLLELDFTGWTGRYYHSLDTLLNPDIPGWMRRLHRYYYKKPFDYPDIPGMVFVHETERIFVLQMDKDVEHELPIINTGEYLIDQYNLPEFIRYPYWFDVCFAKDTNDVFSTYKIHTTERGDSIMASHHLPNEFPAIIGDHQEHLRWYFCGDWADSPTPFGLSYFKGVQFMRKFFYNNRDDLDRKKFFWEYYEPLVSGLFNDYIDVMDSLEGPRPLPPVHRNYIPYYRRYNIPLPDVDLIASGRVYNPNEVLGSEYKERAYRDSVLQAEREEASRTGYYIGQYGDTVFLTDKEMMELEEQTRYENSMQSRRDSIKRRRLDSVRGVGEFADPYRLIKIDSTYLRGGRIPVNIPLTKAEMKRRAQMKAAAEKAAQNRAEAIVDSMLDSESGASDTEFEEEDPAPQNEELSAGFNSTNNRPKSTRPILDKRYKLGGRLPSNFKAKDFKAPEEIDAMVYQGESPEPKEELPADNLSQENPNTTESQPEETEAPAQEAISENSGPRWHVIIASFPDKAMAEEFVRRKKKSMELLYVAANDTYRVSYANFEDRRSANKEVINLMTSYPDAWVLKVD
ncbi:SPOR domain-containing protein [Croceimicrobium hydrocarbonivorans]|uniref:SPOR domain-containing protein n=1 Tax=Croceimicrobium hydrocarbonivorans TaxID=2761580 RepID=A0A7H0VAT0_9FLAO|nr:SPOR domain-containing protein [Croceimicrobium hydrocarbonivorans]QNR22828.1 SPOR domain-containing protein [Croceimicrobium hydrocarbonivorans]